MVFTLPPLPYDYSALNPYIDTETMQVRGVSYRLDATVCNYQVCRSSIGNAC